MKKIIAMNYQNNNIYENVDITFYNWIKMSQETNTSSTNLDYNLFNYKAIENLCSDLPIKDDDVIDFYLKPNAGGYKEIYSNLELSSIDINSGKIFLSQMLVSTFMASVERLPYIIYCGQLKLDNNSIIKRFSEK